MTLSKKVLLVSPPFIPVSKDSVAGIEQVTYSLGKSLVEQGYDVYTVAREDSEVYGKLISGGFSDLKAFPGAEFEHFHQSMAYVAFVLRDFLRNNGDVGVIVDRCQGVSLLTSHEENGPPVICGLDMEPKYFLHPKLFDVFKEKLRERDDSFVAVAEHVAKDYLEALKLKEANLGERMNVVHNGIITDNFPFSAGLGDSLLYLGRIREGKAPHLAIKVAHETGMPLVLAGGDVPLSEGSQYEDREYFEREIQPLLDSQITFVGPVGLEEKVKLMQESRAVVFPSLERETFGLVPVESMACGTPAIAFNRGGPRETIVDGKTGFLVDSFEEMVGAVNKVDEIDRERCHSHVRENFDYRLMGRRYGDLIEQTS
ncbi:MAG TPA: glycosyltransferase family 4 protein [Candidatus Pacearchaeota archaeon]|nr:glycosyltransferase family 4 protein [Candidatus Pacearchaeota archaeon]